jgi:hypothetical protein
MLALLVWVAMVNLVSERWIVAYAILTWCSSILTPFLCGGHYAPSYEDPIPDHHSMRRTFRSLEKSSHRDRIEPRPRKRSHRERRAEIGHCSGVDRVCGQAIFRVIPGKQAGTQGGASHITRKIGDATNHTKKCVRQAWIISWR